MGTENIPVFVYTLRPCFPIMIFSANRNDVMTQHPYNATFSQLSTNSIYFTFWCINLIKIILIKFVFPKSLIYTIQKRSLSYLLFNTKWRFFSIKDFVNKFFLVSWRTLCMYVIY